MHIDRSNYEIWLIDWLDGRLNEVQVHTLQLFLKDNPDLNEEVEDHDSLRLEPPKNEFPYKKQLLKTAAGLTDSQFDYLCAGYLENDLSPEQRTELTEAISGDPAKSKSFEVIRKMKLVPPAAIYSRKSKLIKRTFAAKILRLSVIGLSAAATIAAVLFIVNPKPAGYTSYEQPAGIVKNNTPTVNETVKDTSAVTEKMNPSSSRQKNKQIFVAASSFSPAANEFETREHITKNDPEETLVNTVNTARISSEIDLRGKAFSNTLVELKTSNMTVVNDDGRSKFSKIIAKTFREKILKEDTPQDKPLKVYEIAEASVSGLNKILGWEMALDEKSSADGKTEKIYFSSRILKINAPVKK